jgi:hypothetical protein
MAYTGRGTTGNRGSHGLAIAWAFAGQAAMIVGVAALTAGHGGTAVSAQGSAMPATAPPAPTITTVPDIQPLTKPSAGFGYQVTVDGKSIAGKFPSSPTPAFTVKPGQDLTIAVDLTFPPAQDATPLSVSLFGDNGKTGTPETGVPYNEIIRNPSAGTNVFILRWHAGALRPGTQWTLSLYGVAIPGSDSDPIANITVAS